MRGTKILLKKKEIENKNMVMNLSEDKKQRLVEYSKIYYEIRKNNSKIAQ